MPGVHLSNDEFFARLTELFDGRKKKDHGSIFLTQKRMKFGDTSDATLDTKASDVFHDLHLQNPTPIIIRATNGKSKKPGAEKIKLSTIVEAESQDIFFTRYAEACKMGMSGLKKRDRSKGKKKMKAKRRKETTAGGTEEINKP